MHIHNAATVFFSWPSDSQLGTAPLRFEHEDNDCLNHHSGHKQPSSTLWDFFFSFFSYLFKHFNSACNVSENGSDVIICNDTSLPQPVIPSWLRWRYWFGWDYMQINHDIGRSVVFQSASVGDFPLVIVSPAHMVWLQHLYRLVTVY